VTTILGSPSLLSTVSTSLPEEDYPLSSALFLIDSLIRVTLFSTRDDLDKEPLAERAARLSFPTVTGITAAAFPVG